MTAVRGVLFDKDGTLFDFHLSWGSWAAALLRDLTAGDDVAATRIGHAMGYDLVARRFDPDSPVIAGTPQEVAALLSPQLPGMSQEVLLARINASAGEARMVPAVPLEPLLSGLRGRGLRLGVATNDAEAPAQAHLEAADVAGHFEFIAGFDSGHGAKPAPGMLLAFARAARLAPESVLMVGDSTHDLLAGRAAGMRTVGVLTGPAGHADLAPHAHSVIRDIGALPALLDELAVTPG